MGIKFLQNIDAERNKFEEAGFEVVSALPTTNLFAGREVFYKGKKWMYDGTRWVNIDNNYTSYLSNKNDIGRLQIVTNIPNNTLHFGFRLSIKIDGYGVAEYIIRCHIVRSIIYREAVTCVTSSSFFAGLDVHFEIVDNNFSLSLGEYNTDWRMNNNIIDIRISDYTYNIQNIVISPQFRFVTEATDTALNVKTLRAEVISPYTTQQIKSVVTSNNGLSNQKSYFSTKETGGIGYEINNPIGDWANSYLFYKFNDTLASIIGLYGNATGIIYAYIGGQYNNCAARLIPDNNGDLSRLDIDNAGNIYPYSHHGWDCGAPDRAWNRVHSNKFIKTGGTATQMLMADGSTKDISGFAASGDIPTQLPNPNPIIIKTADGVLVRYDGSASGGVILEAGDNAELTATQDSDDTMTVKFGAVVPTKLPNPQALTIRVVDDIDAALGPDILYDGLTAKILKLVAGYGIELNSVNLTGGQAVAINLKQIAGTTLLGNVNGTTGTPDAVTMDDLRSMLGSLTINSLTITLGGNNSYELPCYMQLGNKYYQVRLTDNALQIYRAGVWVTYGRFCTCRNSGSVTGSEPKDWFVTDTFDYEFDSDASHSLLDSKAFPERNFGTAMANAWGGERTTLNLEFVTILKDDTQLAWDTMKKNLASCFPEKVGKVRFAYNIAIPSGNVKTRIEMSYKEDVGIVTTTFYTEG